MYEVYTVASTLLGAFWFTCGIAAFMTWLLVLLEDDTQGLSVHDLARGRRGLALALQNNGTPAFSFPFFFVLVLTIVSGPVFLVYIGGYAATSLFRSKSENKMA